MRIPLFSNLSCKRYTSPLIFMSVSSINSSCLKDLSILFKIFLVKYYSGNPELAALLFNFGSRIRFYSIQFSSSSFSCSLCSLSSCSLADHFGTSPSYWGTLIPLKIFSTNVSHHSLYSAYPSSPSYMPASSIPCNSSLVSILSTWYLHCSSMR